MTVVPIGGIPSSSVGQHHVRDQVPGLSVLLPGASFLTGNAGRRMIGLWIRYS